MEEFSFKEIKKYVAYVGDSYTHIRQHVPGNVVDIMNYFHSINLMIRAANERYKVDSKKIER